MSHSQSTTKSVLVVEDDAGISSTLKHLLENEGYTVVVAEHGRDGLSLLREMAPPCVVLLDIQMPVMDGYEFLRQKSADPAIADIAVVVLSATADPNEISGASDFIRKPFEIPRLLQAVQQHCLG